MCLLLQVKAMPPVSYPHPVASMPIQMRAGGKAFAAVCKGSSLPTLCACCERPPCRADPLTAEALPAPLLYMFFPRAPWPWHQLPSSAPLPPFSSTLPEKQTSGALNFKAEPPAPLCPLPSPSPQKDLWEGASEENRLRVSPTPGIALGGNIPNTHSDCQGRK